MAAFQRVLLSFAFIGLRLSSAYAEGEVSVHLVSPSSAPIKVIFFIHGLNGKPDAFCDLPEMVKDALKTEFPDLANQFHIFSPSYESEGNDRDSAREFAIGPVANQIRAFYAKNNIDVNEPYAIVAHSQGGLVTSFFSFLCIKGESIAESDKIDSKECRDVSVPKNLRKVITLGTPFWGSSVASAGATIKGLTPGILKGQINAILPVDQIATMSYGSPQNSDLRWMYMGKNPYGNTQPDPKEIVMLNGPFWRDTEVFNIAGVMSEQSFKDYSFGGKLVLAYEKYVSTGYFQREGDFAVDVAAARPDFHYWIESDPRYKDQKSPIYGTTNVALSRYIMVSLPHIPIQGSQSEACVIENHFSDSRKHPVYRLLTHILAGKPLSVDDVQELSSRVPISRNFLSQVTINLPEGYQRPILDRKHWQTDIQISEYTDGPLSKIENLTIGGETPLSRYTRVDDGPTDLAFFNNEDVQMYQTFTHQGRFKVGYGYQPDKTPYQEYFFREKMYGRINAEDHPEIVGVGATEPALINYEFKIPGWKIKKIDLRVSPTFSSYAEVYASPKFPLPSVRGKGGAQQSLNAETGRLFNLGSAEYYLLSAYTANDSVPPKPMERRAFDLTPPQNNVSVLLMKRGHDNSLVLTEIKMPRAEAELITDLLPGVKLETMQRLRKRSLDPKVFNRCYIGRVGRLNGQEGGVHTGGVFARFEDKKPRPGPQLKEGDLVEVRGRYDSPDRKLDRYLISPVNTSARTIESSDQLTAVTFLWANVIDIDWVGMQSCEGKVSHILRVRLQRGDRFLEQKRSSR